MDIEINILEQSEMGVVVECPPLERETLELWFYEEYEEYRKEYR